MSNSRLDQVHPNNSRCVVALRKIGAATQDDDRAAANRPCDHLMDKTELNRRLALSLMYSVMSKRRMSLFSGRIVCYRGAVPRLNQSGGEKHSQTDGAHCEPLGQGGPFAEGKRANGGPEHGNQ